MDYISKENVKMIFNEACKKKCIHPEALFCNGCLVNDIFRIIEKFPSADVVERNTFQHAQHVESVENALDVPERNVGKWEIIDEAEPRRYGCSNCKRMAWHIENFCPNCGAKMEGNE